MNVACPLFLVRTPDTPLRAWLLSTLIFYLNGSSSKNIRKERQQNRHTDKITRKRGIWDALQLEAVWHRASPISFNYDTHVKFEVAQLNSSVAVL